MNTARDFLRLLTEKLPPPEGCHHSLVLREDDPTGLDLVLFLTGDTGNKWQMMHLDRDDLEKAPHELVSEVLGLIVREP